MLCKSVSSVILVCADRPAGRRVGFLETEQPVNVALPHTVAALEEGWEIKEQVPTAPSWDFMWNGAAEEGREKQVAQQSFVLGGNQLPPSRSYPSESIYVADIALKVRMKSSSLVHLFTFK